MNPIVFSPSIGRIDSNRNRPGLCASGPPQVNASVLQEVRIH